MGAVIFDSRNTEVVKAFGVHVPDILLEEWRSAGKRHLIGPVEMYAVILARSTWTAQVGGRRIIYFVDHCGVMNSCIKGPSAFCCLLLPRFRDLLVVLRSRTTVGAVMARTAWKKKTSVKGPSADKTWRKLLCEFEKQEANHPTIPWFCRAASQSNIADDPSRGMWSEMMKLYRFARCHPICPITRMKLRECSLQSV